MLFASSLSFPHSIIFLRSIQPHRRRRASRCLRHPNISERERTCRVRSVKHYPASKKKTCGTKTKTKKLFSSDYAPSPPPGKKNASFLALTVSAEEGPPRAIAFAASAPIALVFAACIARSFATLEVVHISGAQKHQVPSGWVN